MENKIRNTLNEIYFGKTKDIVNGLRYVMSISYHTFSFSGEVKDKRLRKFQILNAHSKAVLINLFKTRFTF